MYEIQHLALILYKDNNALKIVLCTFCLTALFECINVLLEYINTFVLDVFNVFPHDYCTSDQELQNKL